MLTRVIGQHTGEPYAYIDLCEGIRMGDLLGLRMWFEAWRKVYPQRKIFVLHNRYHPRSIHATNMDVGWALADVADEIWEPSTPGEVLPPPPPGDLFANIYTKTKLWQLWKRYYNDSSLTTKVHWPPHALAGAASLQDFMGIHGPFIVVQPLLDATYNVSRNKPAEWWKELITTIARTVPVAVVGTQTTLQAVGLHRGNNVFPLSFTEDTRTVLLLASRSALYVGGETGLTLWAAALRVPVLALYRTWATGKQDVRPRSFGAAVNFCALDTPVAAIAQRAIVAFSRTKSNVVSTIQAKHSK